MDDDFAEFFSVVGTETPCYGICQGCEDLFIRDPENYNKPKMECDPDDVDGCKLFLPVCECRNGHVLFSQEELDECTYPNCEYGCENG